MLLTLLMDTIVVIGDLTASESFSESAFCVENDLFKTLMQVIRSPTITLMDKQTINLNSERTIKSKSDQSDVRIEQ